MTRRRAVWIALGVVVLVPLVLMVETAPAMPEAAAPSAEQVRAGRDAFRRLKKALAGPPPASKVEFSAGDLNDIAALVGNIGKVDRVAAGVSGGIVKGAVSLDLPLGLWLNLRASAAPSTAGFPRIDAQIGDLPVPAFVVRGGAELAATVLRWRGAKLPALDELVRAVAVSDGAVAVLVKSPVIGTGVVEDMFAAVTTPANPARTAAIFCQLAAQQQKAPSRDLAVQLARALALADPLTPEAAVSENRAALVAVAMLAVGPSAGRLAGNVAPIADSCVVATGELELAGRRDLAKHWSLSAALGATVGGDVGEAMGNWKELSDSLKGGSGFSFVDLAADRAGLGVGRAAIDRGRAIEIRQQLRAADNAALLPLDAKALAEGMSNEAFVARYGDINSADYQAALARIDMLLKQRGTIGTF